MLNHYTYTSDTPNTDPATSRALEVYIPRHIMGDIVIDKASEALRNEKAVNRKSGPAVVANDRSAASIDNTANVSTTTTTAYTTMNPHAPDRHVRCRRCGVVTGAGIQE